MSTTKIKRLFKFLASLRKARASWLTTISQKIKGVSCFSKLRTDPPSICKRVSKDLDQVMYNIESLLSKITRYHARQSQNTSQPVKSSCEQKKKWSKTSTSTPASNLIYHFFGFVSQQVSKLHICQWEKGTLCTTNTYLTVTPSKKRIIKNNRTSAGQLICLVLCQTVKVIEVGVAGHTLRLFCSSTTRTIGCKLKPPLITQYSPWEPVFLGSTLALYRTLSLL